MLEKLNSKKRDYLILAKKLPSCGNRELSSARKRKLFST